MVGGESTSATLRGKARASSRQLLAHLPRPRGPSQRHLVGYSGRRRPEARAMRVIASRRGFRACEVDAVASPPRSGGREDDLLDAPAASSRLRSSRTLSPRARSVQRRERPRDVVAARNFPCARAEEVVGSRHAEEAGIAPGIATDAAGIFLGKREAHLQWTMRALAGQRIGQRRHLVGRPLERKKVSRGAVLVRCPAGAGGLDRRATGRGSTPSHPEPGSFRSLRELGSSRLDHPRTSEGLVARRETRSSSICASVGLITRDRS